MGDMKQCSERVFSGQRWDTGGHQCGKSATLEHEGKRYCKVHYPPNVWVKRELEDRVRRERLDAERRTADEKIEAQAELKRKASAYDRLERYLSNIEADVSKYAIVTTSEIRLILEGK